MTVWPVIIAAPAHRKKIVSAMFFLCAGAAMITGQTVIVDGGLTL